jgi:hypothetical protein
MKTPSIRRFRKHNFPVMLREAARAFPRTVRVVRTARNINWTSVGSFVVFVPPGTTRSGRTSPHCLARNIARPPSRLLLKPHSHSTAFQSPGFPRQAPGTTPAAAELPALAMFFVSRFTSLSGVTRTYRHRMRCSPELHIVCTTMLMVISGDRT